MNGEGREPYRKLPGHRRGILRSASVWLGPDHLLSVKSLRFREEYKRFHFRDVQAIVVVRTPRFHISTRALLIGWLWWVVFVAAVNLGTAFLVALGIIGAGLIGAWAYISSSASCRCRIHTAVSREELPSVYRTWTAERFLAEVEPHIRAVQGTVEANWPETLEQQRAQLAPAPPPPRPTLTGGVPPPPRPEPAAALPPPPGADPTGARSRTSITDVFLTSLFADAILNLATLHSLTRTLQWVWYGLAFFQVGCAVMIFVQRHRGILKNGMQKLAIATLIVMGAGYYFRQVLESVARSSQPAGFDPSTITSSQGYVVLREVFAGISIVLGIVGVLLSVRDRIRED